MGRHRRPIRRPKGWYPPDWHAEDVSLRPSQVDLDSSRLPPGTHHFNGCVFRASGGLALAYRLMTSDDWQDSRIAFCRLDAQWQPVADSNRVMEPSLVAGPVAEDPRVVHHAGETLLTYCNEDRQFLCDLDPNSFDTKDHRLLHHASANVRERNWQLFSHNGQFFAVYSIEPHRVLRVRRDSAQPIAKCEEAFCTPNKHLWHWKWGQPCGGTPPVRVGGRYFSFFHSHVTNKGCRTYYVGLYCFSADPPFEVLGCSLEPVLAAEAQNEKPSFNAGHAVVFPCGALFDERRGEWLVSAGINDRRIRLFTFDHHNLVRRMTMAVPPVHTEDAVARRLNWRPFLVATQGRCGTHMLRTSLCQHPQVICRDELFNPYSAMAENELPGFMGMSISEAVLRAFSPPPGGDHLRVVLPVIHGQHNSPRWKDVHRSIVEAFPQLRVVYLSREDKLAQYVSFQKAARNNQWRSYSGQPDGNAKRINIDVGHFAKALKRWRKEEDKVRRILAGCPSLEVKYEDLRDSYDDTMERLQAFLGVDSQPLEPATKRQSKDEGLSNLVVNWEEASDVI
jgi:predicted GH43/DUF377 family glycosyl hydrolase